MYAAANPVELLDPTGLSFLASFGVSFSARVQLAASRIGSALVLYDRVDTVLSIAKLAAQFLATGTVNPIELATVAASIIPGSGIFKRIKAVVPTSFVNSLNMTGRLSGSTKFLTEAARHFPGTKYLYNADGAVAKISAIAGRWKEDVGEMGLGLVAEKMGLRLWGGRIRNGVQGIDGIFRNGNKWFIGEAKGTKSLHSNLADHLNDLPGGYQQMSKYWILEKIDEVKKLDPHLGSELEGAMNSGRLFGLLSVTQVDELTGAVTDPEYVIRAFNEIGDFAF